jgi:hypothetical protein
MELCTQCNQPESTHTRRIFGHRFQRPTANQQNQAEGNPYYAGDLVDALSDAVPSFDSGGGGDSAGCDAGSGGDCGGGGE